MCKTINFISEDKFGKKSWQSKRVDCEDSRCTLSVKYIPIEKKAKPISKMTQFEIDCMNETIKRQQMKSKNFI